MPAHKLFLFGLDKAGKTTLSHFIKEAKEIQPRPTLAFNLDKWIIKDLEFQIWDAPGQVSLRYVWKNGFNRAKILMFVLDCSHPERFEEAFTEFNQVIMNADTRGIPLVFCFHKWDIDLAQASYNDARAVFKLPLITDRPVFSYRTTVKNLETSKIPSNEDIGGLKLKLVELIQSERWGT
ncbi:hypothetical protein NEF87_000555 [Candidatus Lokiarchaeum ossiferum]|uniref:GTP-binding protein n=1 Tax=Candidatus Lokiarchaeum ossiferum TaxID=2951803 RepID=A0ABY6HLK4_9ARCH|nr:hypothetical protein NEF87_000555 [Candidatus Lokiarchaeum sp. B-35]